MHLDINHMIRKKAISHTPARTTFHSRDNDTKEKKIIRLRFLGDLSFKLARVLQTFGFHAAFHPVDATKKIFSKLKDPIPPDEKSAVYKLQWGDWDALYIGQTGRKLKSRVCEHNFATYRNASDAGDGNKSRFAVHLINSNHSFDRKRVHLLHQEEGDKKRIALETVEFVKTGVII